MLLVIPRNYTLTEGMSHTVSQDVLGPMDLLGPELLGAIQHVGLLTGFGPTAAGP